MKKILFISTTIIITMIMTGCGGTYNIVSSDFERSVDFTKYRTFACQPDKADT